jgi:hypothetical protein
MITHKFSRSLFLVAAAYFVVVSSTLETAHAAPRTTTPNQDALIRCVYYTIPVPLIKKYYSAMARTAGQADMSPVFGLARRALTNPRCARIVEGAKAELMKAPGYTGTNPMGKLMLEVVARMYGLYIDEFDS